MKTGAGRTRGQKGDAGSKGFFHEQAAKLARIASAQLTRLRINAERGTGPTMLKLTQGHHDGMRGTQNKLLIFLDIGFLCNIALGSVHEGLRFSGIAVHFRSAQGCQPQIGIWLSTKQTNKPASWFACSPRKMSQKWRYIGT